VNAHAAEDLRSWTTDSVRRREAWIAVCVAAASIFLFVVDAGLVALALPKIAAEYPKVARGTLAWIATGFLVAQSSLLLIGGRLADRRGRKGYYLFGLTLFSVGAALTAVAPSIAWIIAARVVQGVGGAFLASSALALVLPMFPRSKAPAVIGVWGAIGSVAAWLTPTLGALIVDINWRYAFGGLAPLGVIVALIGRRVLHTQTVTDTEGRTDRLSYYVGPVGLGMLMLVLAQGSRWGWASPLVIGLGGLAVVLITVFLRRCLTAEVPLLDLAILRNRAFAANAIAGALQQTGFFGWFLTAPLIMTALWGWSVRQAGLAVALGQVMSSVASPLGGQLAIRYGNTRPIVVSSFITAAGSLWFLATATAQPNFFGVLLPAAVLMGFGSGMCGTMTTGAALAALPATMLGAGNSLVQLLRRMGGALGVALAAGLLGEGSRNDLLPGARRVWWMVTILHIGMSTPLWWAAAHRRRQDGSSRMVT
jgi:EmrB/QacA subfamily drug resistance transporter